MDDPTSLPALLMEKLDQYPMVQPWSLANDLGPEGVAMEIHRSFAWFAHNYPDTFFTSSTPTETDTTKILNRKWHPGYASAFRRSVLEDIGGLFEEGLIGSGDFHMLMGLYNKAELSIKDGVHPNYRKAVLEWQQRAQEVTHGRFGYLDLTIDHAFHGFKLHRQYESRKQILVDEQFDPETFAYKNADSVWEFHDTAQTQRIKERIIEYFRSRNEDIAILETMEFKP